MSDCHSCHPISATHILYLLILKKNRTSFFVCLSQSLYLFLSSRCVSVGRMVRGVQGESSQSNCQPSGHPDSSLTTRVSTAMYMLHPIVFSLSCNRCFLGDWNVLSTGYLILSVHSFIFVLSSLSSMSRDEKYYEYLLSNPLSVLTDSTPTETVAECLLSPSKARHVVVPPPSTSLFVVRTPKANASLINLKDFENQVRFFVCVCLFVMLKMHS